MRRFFKVLYHSKKSKARLGRITTDSGVINTPAFVPVGTKGTIKSILPSLLKPIGIQVSFVNTYHLVTHPGAAVIKKAGGIHQYAGLNIPLMSDSGGFQIFSLARKKDSASKFLSHDNQISAKEEFLRKQQKNSPSSLLTKSDIYQEKQPILVKISDDGVQFHSTFDGSLIEFTPEKSIEYQEKIGADIIMAFDECIPYSANYQYTKEATERTHRWLIRCLKKFRKKKAKIKTSVINRQFSGAKKQYLYGIIQGGVFEDWRKKSAAFVVSQPVDGVAIGGVSVGESKEEMRQQVKWVSDYLPKDKPVHLLGVGQVDDILDLVKYGIDSFDCVEPTRLGRMGIIYKIQNSKDQINKIDILKGKYRGDLSPVDENCCCFVCQTFTKSYLHHLFKNRELLSYSLATYHNLWVMERFFEWIRKKIAEDKI